MSHGRQLGHDVRGYVPGYHWDNDNGTKWWTVGIRPMYKWTNHEHRDGNRLRQRRIPALMMKEKNNNGSQPTSFLDFLIFV
ncbi:hypothetical protein [Shigella flexneri]|uniref:hypothetical protein n=1 Tax=Shigella flexneri TaxID=623 RepID=UPI003F53F8C1